MKLDLRTYQKEAIGKVKSDFMNNHGAVLVAIPTGGGKTVVFCHLPQELKRAGLMAPNAKTLILAHRDELLQQAKEKMAWVDPSLNVGIEGGPHECNGNEDIVIASVPTIGRANLKRISKFNRSDFGLIICDEAHHAIASTYKRVFSYFKGIPHVGFTATPFRGDRKSLRKVYERIAYRKTLKQMITEKWLAHPRGFRVRSNVDISRVAVQRGEYVNSELGRAVNEENRNALTVKSYMKWGAGERAIVFCVDVEHAEEMRDCFDLAGIPAACVTGKTPKAERSEILKSFKRGDIKVVTNCAVLTEGYDEPLVKTIIMARPTRSLLLYMQMLGRGMRIPPGEQQYTMNVIDIVDAGRNANETMNLNISFGLPPSVDNKGKKVLEVVDMIRDVERRGHEVMNIQDVSCVEEIFEEHNLFNIPKIPDVVKSGSKYLWQHLSNGAFFLGLPDKQWAMLDVDPMGDWRLTASYNGQKVDQVITGRTERSRLRKADKLLESIDGKDDWGRPKLGKVMWKWIESYPGRQAVTDKQKNALKAWRIRTKQELTKGEASLLLSRVVGSAQGRKRSKSIV